MRGDCILINLRCLWPSSPLWNSIRPPLYPAITLFKHWDDIRSGFYDPQEISFRFFKESIPECKDTQTSLWKKYLGTLPFEYLRPLFRRMSVPSFPASSQPGQAAGGVVLPLKALPAGYFRMSMQSWGIPKLHQIGTSYLTFFSEHFQVTFTNHTMIWTLQGPSGRTTTTCLRSISVPLPTGFIGSLNPASRQSPAPQAGAARPS